MLATNQTPSHLHHDFEEVVFFLPLARVVGSKNRKKHPIPYFLFLSKIRGRGISGRHAKHGKLPLGLTSC